MNAMDGLSRNRANAAAVLIIVGGLAAVVVGTWVLLDRWWSGSAPVQAVAAPAPVTSAPDTSTADVAVRPASNASATPSRNSHAVTASAPIATPVTPLIESQSPAVTDASLAPEPVAASVSDASISVITPSSGAAPSDVSTSLVTYQDGDIDVTPPAPIKPSFLEGLRPSSPGVRLDALTIAVTVNPDGSVESVKGLNAPQNISEYLMLSMALGWVKSWKFTPATKDGAPVKFRHVVPLRELTASVP